MNKNDLIIRCKKQRNTVVRLFALMEISIFTIKAVLTMHGISA